MDLRQIVRERAQAHGVDPNIAEAVMMTESGGKPNALSPAGAYGPMQLMEPTAKGLGVDRNDPLQNIDGGVRYLKENLTRFNGDVGSALAAYNAGPGRVSKVTDFSQLPTETRNYVPKVMNMAATLADRQQPQQQPVGQPPSQSAIDLGSLHSMFGKATAANDTEAAAEISGVLTQQYGNMLKKAQAAGDREAVAEITQAISSFGGKPAPAPAPANTANKPVAPAKAQATAVKQETPTDLRKTALDALQGAGDTLSFGFLDEGAGKVAGMLGYDGDKVTQRLRDRAKDAGPAYMAGQLGGALVPGLGTLGAIRAVPTAGRIVRAAAGVGTGAVQGGLYGAGSAEDGKRVEGATEGALFGAGAGGVLGGVIPASTKQKVNTFVKKAGSDDNAAINAEVAQRIRKEFDSVARQAETGVAPALTPKEVNSKVTSAILREGKAVIDRLPKETAGKQELTAALLRGLSNSQDELAALSKVAGGRQVVDIINQATRADKLTSQLLQDPTFLASATRLGINAIPPAIGGAIGGPAGFAAGALASKFVDPLAKKLTGKMTRTEVTQRLVDKVSGISDDVLTKTGPSTASKSLQQLTQMAEKAQSTQQAKVAAGKASKQAATEAAEQLRIRNLDLGIRSKPGFTPDNLKITGGTRGTLQYYGRLADSKELAKGLRMIEKTDPYLKPYVDAVKQNKNVPNGELLLGLTDRLQRLRDQGVLKPYMKKP